MNRLISIGVLFPKIIFKGDFMLNGFKIQGFKVYTNLTYVINKLIMRYPIKSPIIL